MSEAQSLPVVIWITGLSGAGKTTLGKQVYQELRHFQSAAIFLDGDVVREVLGKDLSHSPQDRLTNAYRLARLSKMILDQGISVVCSTMSLFPEIWRWNRANIGNYFEVYLHASKDTLLQRDHKELYQRATGGDESNVVGVDTPFNEPIDAHHIIDSDTTSLEQLPSLASQIIRQALDRMGKS